MAPRAQRKRKRSPTPSSSSSSDSDDTSKIERGNGTAEPQKCVKRDHTDTITVVVGEEAKEFTVHESIIYNKSTFFEAACSKKWIEGQERKVKLPEQSPGTFCFYVDWVYRDKLDVNGMESINYPCTIEDAMRSPTEAMASLMRSMTLVDVLCHLSILADFLGDFPCQNVCMEALEAKGHETGSIAYLIGVPHCRTVDLVAANASVGCGLFRWMVDELALFAIRIAKDPMHLATHLENRPAVVKDELLKRIFTALQLRGTDGPVVIQRGSYLN